MPNFTGDETAADLLRLLLDDFVDSPLSKAIGGDIKIIHSKDWPILIFEARLKDGLGQFICNYRLDEMMARVFPLCEQIYDDANERGLFGKDYKGRDKGVRYLAYSAMSTVLHRLLILQMTMFSEVYDDTAFLTESSFLNAYAQVRQHSDGSKIIKTTNVRVRKMLDDRVDAAAKKKRDQLVLLLNSLPSLQIPTGVGRPTGSTKPAERKAQEAAEFEKRIEETIQTLFAVKGKLPTKTAVAEALGMGGVNPRRGSDTRINSFNNKLARLKVDYRAIVQRLDLH